MTDTLDQERADLATSALACRARHQRLTDLTWPAASHTACPPEIHLRLPPSVWRDDPGSLG
ncbi:MAG: hypothetical protein P4L71_21365 [Acetobacteraceae bacterium]|nr:hypothetical protein [Acetobacteraceae bacterium]